MKNQKNILIHDVPAPLYEAYKMAVKRRNFKLTLREAIVQQMLQLVQDPGVSLPEVDPRVMNGSPINTLTGAPASARQ